MSKKNISEAKTLEQYRVTFENTALQPEIASTMAEYGYDDAKVAEGKALYETTRVEFDANQTESDEAAAAYAVFAAKKDQLGAIYSSHRKKAKVVFRDDPTTADRLEISGTMPVAYVKWLEAVRKFYNTSIADAEIQKKLSRLKLTTDDLNAAKAMIPEVEALRAAYLKEKGESQNATAIKDTAFAELDSWMSEFYAVAKIAMEDQPQLLETLGLIVRR